MIHATRETQGTCVSFESRVTCVFARSLIFDPILETTLRLFFSVNLRLQRNFQREKKEAPISTC